MAVEHTAPLTDDKHEPIGSGSQFEPSKVDERERRLGRYELIYEIGHGGMANVFLARARGPAGFQKWFAIKRVHDQLAKTAGFVEMFLDEARIAAAIQHPNVAQVFDLGESNGRYFLAMEYLHGEPLTSLATRCAVSMGQVPPGIAAYIVARAADGLHHAHEATDGKGVSMNLVHRDVSPHNVFVTYDGQVKLTDFGVAKAAGRITHTETGVVKGKLAYASPEQLRGDELDRRSDIFALGIVLWEIATGRRLFRAASDAATLHRIYSGYRLSPRSLVSGFPEELEAIIDRALAHEVEDRYETAAEMSRDLDRFLATSDLASGSVEVARTMRSLFESQIAAKDAILHRDPNDDSPSSIEVDLDEVEEPSRSQMRRSDKSASETLTPPAGLDRDSRRRRWLTALLFIAVALASGLAAWQLSGPSTSLVRIDTSPGGAIVAIDGRPVEGSTPVLVEDVEEGRHHLSIDREGYDTFETDFEAHGNRVELHYALVQTVPAGPGGQDGEGGRDTTARDTSGGDTSGGDTSGGDTSGGATGAGDTGAGDTGAGDTGAGDTGAGDTSGGDGDGPGRADRGTTTNGTNPGSTAGSGDTPPSGDRGTSAARPSGRRGTRRGTRRGSTSRVTATPARPGTLTLITRPWARVWINGRDYGTTPLYRREVPSGTVRIRLQPEGSGPSVNRTVELPAGGSLSRNYSLN